MEHYAAPLLLTFNRLKGPGEPLLRSSATGSSKDAAMLKSTSIGRRSECKTTFSLGASAEALR